MRLHCDLSSRQGSLPSFYSADRMRSFLVCLNIKGKELQKHFALQLQIGNLDQIHQNGYKIYSWAI